MTSHDMKRLKLAAWAVVEAFGPDPATHADLLQALRTALEADGVRASHIDRVLDAFEPGVWRQQRDIRHEVTLDTSSCLSVLRHLVDTDVLEFREGERQRKVQGRRPYEYRLVMREEQ